MIIPGIAGKQASDGSLDVTVVGGGAGGGAVTVADGADVVEGSLADAANTTGTTGTINGKQRGIVQLLAACISIGSNWMQVSIQNATLAVTQSGSWTVSQSGNAAVLSNQVAVTGSAVALASNPCKSVTVKALVGNTIAVYVGPAGITIGTGYELFAGDSITLAISNTNILYLIASTTGASISWIASN